MTECWVAIHKETKTYFHSKTTQVGYKHLMALKQAMIFHKANAEEYEIICIDANTMYELFQVAKQNAGE